MVHTSHGSSSRPVGGEGYSGYSSSSHQPTYHMVCFECGYIGLFVRDCPRTKRWGIHLGSQSSTFKVEQPLARGGVESSRGGPHSGRGCYLSGRGGCRGITQYEGGRSHCYAFPGRPQAEASDAPITGIILVCH